MPKDQVEQIDINGKLSIVADLQCPGEKNNHQVHIYLMKMVPREAFVPGQNSFVVRLVNPKWWTDTANGGIWFERLGVYSVLNSEVPH